MRPLLLVSSMALVLMSCAPSNTPGSGPSSSGSGGEQVSSSGPKTIRIAMQAQAEPNEGIINVVSGASIGGSAAFEHELTFHADLTTLNPQSNLQAVMATQVPSLEDASWRVFDDGRMEVTWKLRPNIFWHDGSPLKASDFVFGTMIARDATLTNVPRSAGTRLLSEVVAVDDQTVLMRYPQPYAGANQGVHTPALPEHILRPIYERGDLAVFQNHPYWTTEFIGLGPFKLGQWESGSFLEGRAFDQYFLGKPKVDRILIRYYGDVNTMIAALLAGDLDVLPAGAQLDTGQLRVIRDAWQAEQKGTVQPVPKGTRNVIPQMRGQDLPWVKDIRVRQAIAHTIDRQLLVDTLLDGLTIPANVSITPEMEAFRLLEQRGMSKFVYDPAAAERLLNASGWTRGPDRVFRNAAGQPFDMEVTASAQADNIKEIEVLAAQWSAFGFQSKPVPFPPAATNTDELKAIYPGMMVWPASSLLNAIQGFATDQIPTERTRWRGRNFGGYSNPAYDRLTAEYNATLDPMKGQSILADMMKIAHDDVASIPMYYAALGLAYRKGIDGPGTVSPNQAANMWNIHVWEVK